jgi:hypothetical protein
MSPPYIARRGRGDRARHWFENQALSSAIEPRLAPVLIVQEVQVVAFFTFSQGPGWRHFVASVRRAIAAAGRRELVLRQVTRGDGCYRNCGDLNIRFIFST